ncbi:cytochrome c4 [Oxalobacteraceae bacterium OM1]|nr:cytochrome c4 [Oxalobacteraceae bacterium OM1]
MKTSIRLLLLAALALTGTAQAQNAAQGNAGVTQTVATCAGCHGQKGEGNAQSNFPRLAGQSQAYLAKQLKAYAEGSRNNPIMMPIAKGLSQDQIQAVAAYYAGLDTPSAKTAAPAAQVGKRGEQLANVGDDKIAVQACANCHGPGGSGEPPTYPYLSGQHAGYLSAALGEWKSGARKTDPSMQMNMIAKRLSDSDIAALSAFYAAQPAPAPEPQRTNVAVGTPQRPAAQSSAQSPTSATPTTGGGVEQGAPTTGGAQGIGGGGAASGTGSSGTTNGQGK